VARIVLTTAGGNAMARDLDPWGLIDWSGTFHDKVVLVTGASSGIGQATALAFAAAGARVALVSRRRAALEAVARKAGKRRTLVVPADVTDRAQVRAAFERVVTAWGRVDIVVNNAGVLLPAAVVEMAGADLEAMLRVNLFGALFVMQEAVRQMRAQGGGSIVNVASLAGRRGVSPLGGYCATKFALVGLTEALRTELHGEPIHVALVEPGVVDTPMVENVAHDENFLDLWPSRLNMPPSWVVWAVFAAVRFRLVEISVPPGAATLEKIAALAPGAADAVVHWAKSFMHWVGGPTNGKSITADIPEKSSGSRRG
jgi:NAD(P)-dependent dehydrogenase (short-subunit alcohol dehydrogenase family)